MIKSSEQLKGFIRESEGFSPTAYKDVTGKETIGYGDTVGDKTKTVSVEEAEKRMVDHITMVEGEIAQRVTRANLTQSQMDALVDMTYNLGTTTLEKNGFFDKVNSGNDEEVLNSMRQYTKARDAKTGQLKDFPGLVKRAEERAKMWQAAAELPAAPEQAELSDLDADIDALLDSQSGDSLDADIDALLDETQPVYRDEVAERQSGLQIASEVSSSEELLRMQQARNLSDRLQIPIEEAEAYLSTDSAETIEANSKKGMIAANSPVTSKWASKPENYEVLKKSGNWPMAVEASSNALNKSWFTDANKALAANVQMFEESYTHIGMALNRISKADGVAELKRIERDRQANSFDVYKAETDKLGKAGKKLGNQLGNNFQTIADGFSALSTDFDASLPALRKMYDGTAQGLENVLSYMSIVRKNPEAAALLSLQSSGSFAAPIVGGLAVSALVAPIAGLTVGGMLALTAARIGATLGFSAGAFTGGSLLTFGMFLQEKLQEFVNPETGILDYEAAYGDPKRLQTWRHQAAVYGVTMGAFDAVTTGVLGKFLVAPIKNIAVKGGTKKVAKLATGFALESAVQMGGEGVSEIAASTAAAATGGELNAKTFGEILGKGVEEAVISGPGGMMASVAGAGVRLGVQGVVSAKESLFKTSMRTEQASESNSKYNNLQEVRKAKESNPAGSEHPQQTSELVSEVVTPPSIPEDVSDFTGEISDEAVNQEAQNINKEADADTVNIAPSEWDAIFNEQGLSPEEQMQNFGPAIYDAYVNAKETDSSITIPISEWLRFTEGNPEVDAIARISGSEYNAIEGEDIVNSVKADPFILFSKKEDGTTTTEGLEDFSEEAELEFIQLEDTENEGDPTLRPVKLYDKFRNDDEKKVYKSINSRLKGISKGLRIAPEALEMISELQFRHVRARAEILGVSIDKLAKRLKLARSKKDGARGYFVPSRDIESPFAIALTEDGDLPTVIHEFGHMWLHEMAEDWYFIQALNEDEMTFAQKEYKEVMNIAAEHLGLTNLADIIEGKLSQAQATLIHETFAQTTELYFLEGKFENSRIKKLMESMRVWVKKFAAIIAKGYPQYPPLQITPQVERMFSVILDASNKAEEQVIDMFPDPMFDPEMLGAKGADYIQTIRDVRNDIIGTLAGKALKRNIREREKLINDSLGAIYDEATEQVEAQPIMRLLKQFEDQYAAFKAGDLKSDPRINYESFVDKVLGGDDDYVDGLMAQMPRAMITGKKKGKDNGIDAALFMQQVGITNPEDMTMVAMEAGRKDEKIEEAAALLIEQKFPVLKTDEEIHQLAVEEVQNVGKEKILRKELKLLAEQHLATLKGLIEKAILPASITNKLTKEKVNIDAENMVLDSIVNKFSTEKFLRDSKRHGRRAAQLFRAGNIIEAFNKKYEEMVAFQAFRKASTAMRLMARTKLRAKQFAKYAKTAAMAKQYDVDIMDYGRTLINLVGNGSLDLPSFDITSMTASFAVDDSTVARIDEQIVRFIKATKGQMGPNMPVKAYIQFGEVLDLLFNTARQVKQLEIGNKKLAVEEAAISVVEEIGERRKSDPVEESESNWWKFFQNVGQFRTSISSLFKNDIDFTRSTIGKIYNYVADAEAYRDYKFNTINNKMTAAFKKLGRGNKGLAKIIAPIVNRVPWMTSMDDYKNPVFMKELGVTFKNKGQLLKSLLYMGSESGAQKFLLGGLEKDSPLAAIDIDTGLVDETAFWRDIDALIESGYLTKEDFEFLQSVWDSFEEMYPDVKKVMRDTDGINLGYVAPRAISNKLGDFRGGYIPVKEGEMRTMQRLLESEIDPDNISYPSNDLFPRMNTGFTNERQSVYYPVNLDLQTLSMELAAVANVAYLRKPLLDAGKLLKHSDVVSSLEARRPGIYQKQIIPWYNRIKTQQYSTPSDHPLIPVARILRANVNVALYFGNIATFFRQYIGLLPSITQVGAANLVNGLRQMMVAPKDTREFIVTSSPRMRTRFENMQRNLIKSFDEFDINNDWLTWTTDKTKQFTFVLAQMAQTHVDTATWMGGYEKAKDAGLSESERISFADNAVEKSQSSTALSSFTNIQYGDDFMKLFTMISSVPIAMNNLLQEEYLRNDSAVARAKGMLVLGIMTTLLPSILSTGVTVALSGITGSGDDDEDKKLTEDQKQAKKMKSLGLAMLTDTIDNALPVVGRFMTSGIQTNNPQFSPVLSKVTGVYRAGKAVSRSAQGVEMTASEVSAVFDSLTLLTGRPFSILGRGYKVKENTLTDRESRAFKAKRRNDLERLRRQER